MFRTLVSSAVAFFSLGFPVRAAEPEGPRLFLAGAYAQDITPTRFPISVNGGMQDRQATGVHDRLHARCLILDDGTHKIVLVVCDSCMIPREIFDEAKELAGKTTGIPAGRMLMSATHTHTAPTVGGVFQSDPDEAYRKYLARKIAEGVEQAAKRLQPAKVAWGVGKDSKQVYNRRWFMKPGTLLTDPFGGTSDRVQMNPGYQNPNLDRPAGPIDPDVSFLSVQTAYNKPLAFLANYSLHYVGGVQPLSADYFAAFAERMRYLLGGDEHFVGIMSNGTSGNINNINFGGPAPSRQGEYEQIKIVADSVAQAAYAAYKQEVRHREWVPLRMAEKAIELGVRLPADADVEKAKEIIARAKNGKLVSLPEVYARETVLLAKYPPKVKAKLQAIRIGELGIASSPCETFVEIGLEIKKKSPLKPTFTIELANGYNGYLPTPQHFQLGGYETWRARSSYVTADSGPKITATLLELLKEVAK